MKQFNATIIKNKRISNDFYQLEFSWNNDTDIPKPGQFLTIRISDQYTPLLRRPFAFSAFNKKRFSASIIFQRRGKGTELLAAKVPQDTIDIIGPLGNTFPIPSVTEKLFLVAGGIGLGPILFLSSVLKESDIPAQLIFGCRKNTLIPACESFDQINPQICTDDGSAGFKGTVRDYLQSISQSLTSKSIIYGCGPSLMLKACDEFAQKHNLSCWISVEQIMACGIGACMGCVVKVKQAPGFARACKEGPVFRSSDIVW